MRALGILALIYAVATLTTAALAHAVGSPFKLWFPDSSLLLGVLLATILLLGIVWDGLMVAIGVASEALQRRSPARTEGWPTVASLRSARFFTCGGLPIPILLLTGLAVLGTSNLTLVSLELVGRATHWRDAAFWAIESPVLSLLPGLGVDVAAWDRLYHSAWAIEVVAAFALVLVARGPGIVLHYGATMIVLFYVGRILGVLNPVMGPAFHQPDVFAYLEGSTTHQAMKLVAEIMAQRPDEALSRGGILLGGVSAMPSLHVAMVATTAYWLGVADRRALVVAVPWVLLVWASTVVLGWHYMLDGAGGIVLAGISIAVVRALLRAAGLGLSPTATPAMPALADRRPKPATSAPPSRTRTSRP